MTYFKHFTNVTENPDGYLAWCKGCAWAATRATKYQAVRACKEHQAGTSQDEPSNKATARPSPDAIYGPKVAKLLNLAIGASTEHEANVALIKARTLYARERAA